MKLSHPEVMSRYSVPSCYLLLFMDQFNLLRRRYLYNSTKPRHIIYWGLMRFPKETRPMKYGKSLGFRGNKICTRGQKSLGNARRGRGSGGQYRYVVYNDEDTRTPSCACVHRTCTRLAVPFKTTRSSSVSAHETRRASRGGITVLHYLRQSGI